MYSTSTLIICVKVLFPINTLKKEEPICALLIKHRNAPVQLLSRILFFRERINQNTMQPYFTGLSWNSSWFWLILILNSESHELLVADENSNHPT